MLSLPRDEVTTWKVHANFKGNESNKSAQSRGDVTRSTRKTTIRATRVARAWASSPMPPHPHTGVFVPRLCALSEDRQIAVRLAGWHPPLSGGRQANRARRQNHCLLQRGGRPETLPPRRLCSPTLETFRSPIANRARRPCEMALCADDSSSSELSVTTNCAWTWNDSKSF